MFKKFLCVVSVVSCVLCASTVAFSSDDYPRRPIKLVVAYTPGGGTDRSVRMFQPYLEKHLGQKVVIENKGGAGTEIATTSVANAQPDGYTILVTNYPDLNWTLAFQNPAGYNKDTMETFLISKIDPRIVIVNKDSKYNTFVDFIEDAKANPGKLAVSVGQNSGVHALALYLKNALNIDYKVVPYVGGGQAGAALIGNQVDVCIGDAFSRLNLKGQVKCIAVMGNERNQLWPEGEPLDPQLAPYKVSVPTLNRYEAFVVRRDFKEKYPERYEKLMNAFLEASKDPEYKKVLEDSKMLDIDVWMRKEEAEKALVGQMEFLSETVGPLLNLKK